MSRRYLAPTHNLGSSPICQMRTKILIFASCTMVAMPTFGVQNDANGAVTLYRCGNDYTDNISAEEARSRKCVSLEVEIVKRRAAQRVNPKLAAQLKPRLLKQARNALLFPLSLHFESVGVYVEEGVYSACGNVNALNTGKQGSFHLSRFISRSNGSVTFESDDVKAADHINREYFLVDWMTYCGGLPLLR